jgi:hypothetical protein
MVELRPDFVKAVKCGQRLTKNLNKKRPQGTGGREF